MGNTTFDLFFGVAVIFLGSVYLAAVLMTPPHPIQISPPKNHDGHLFFRIQGGEREKRGGGEKKKGKKRGEGKKIASIWEHLSDFWT